MLKYKLNGETFEIPTTIEAECRQAKTIAARAQKGAEALATGCRELAEILMTIYVSNTVKVNDVDTPDYMGQSKASKDAKLAFWGYVLPDNARWAAVTGKPEAHSPVRKLTDYYLGLMRKQFFATNNADLEGDFDPKREGGHIDPESELGKAFEAVTGTKAAAINDPSRKAPKTPDTPIASFTEALVNEAPVEAFNNLVVILASADLARLAALQGDDAKALRRAIKSINAKLSQLDSKIGAGVTRPTRTRTAA